MKNSITAKIPFSYQDKLLEPSTPIDLDDWMRNGGEELPDFAHILAKTNNFGPYSYELEIMEVSDVVFENPTGLATEFYNEDAQQFDFAGFAMKWLSEQHFEQLSKISEGFLNQTLEKDSPLHKALMAAFALGNRSA